MSVERIRLPSGSVAVRVEGAGPTVIAVHCSSSHSGQWKPLIGAVADRMRVVAPDMHGYGASDPFPVDGRAWFDHDGAMLRRLIDEAGGPVHLAGHSLGAALCLSVARGEARIASLWLYEPVLFSLLEEAGDPLAADAWWVATVMHGLLRLGRPEEAAQSFVDFWSGAGAWAATETRVRDYVVSTIDRVADDWAGVILSLAGQVRLADAAALAVPVRLVRGTRARASAAKITELLHGVIPGAELGELNGMAHMAPVTHPDAVMPDLVGWLDAQIGRT